MQDRARPVLTAPNEGKIVILDIFGATPSNMSSSALQKLISLARLSITY